MAWIFIERDSDLTNPPLIIVLFDNPSLPPEFLEVLWFRGILISKILGQLKMSIPSHSTVSTKSIFAMADSRRPLFVDLDGTLLATDILWESLFILLKTKPLRLLILFARLIYKGKAYFKQELASLVSFNPANLPYREKLLRILEKEKAKGREIYIATASDYHSAKLVADHIGLFTGILASDGLINLSGERKIEAIKKYVGSKPFDYIGNEKKDLPICIAAHNGYLVCPPGKVEKWVAQHLPECLVLLPRDPVFFPLLKCLRLYQWSKNLLLFVPLITSHSIFQVENVLTTLWGFLAFSLCASGVYVFNDLIDLEADRQHSDKKLRPFASGALPLQWGPLIIAICFGGSFAMSLWLLPAVFGMAMVIYVILTTTYSVYLKYIAVVDVFFLAGLYAFRVLVGGITIGIQISPWLLAFSIFFFLSLALVKRFSEIERVKKEGKMFAQGRGYEVGDLSFIGVLGCVSGYLSVLVLCLYITSQSAFDLYRSPQGLWVVSLLLLYWISRLWFFAYRGKMPSDPIVFAFRDRVSCSVYVCVALVIWLSARGI